jgi:hypothetical protein
MWLMRTTGDWFRHHPCEVQMRCGLHDVFTSTPSTCSTPERHVVLNLELDTNRVEKQSVSVSAWLSTLVSRQCGCLELESGNAPFYTDALSTLPIDSVSCPPGMRSKSSSAWSYSPALKKLNSPACIALKSRIHASKGLHAQAVSGSRPCVSRGRRLKSSATHVPVHPFGISAFQTTYFVPWRNASCLLHERGVRVLVARVVVKHGCHVDRVWFTSCVFQTMCSNTSLSHQHRLLCSHMATLLS